MKEEERHSRVKLSEQLLELAEHSSEVEMRQSISRIYYAAFHAAAVLLEFKGAPKDIPSKLGKINEELGADYRRLKAARSRADYMPAYDEDFHAEFSETMRLGRTVLERILELIPASKGDESV